MPTIALIGAGGKMGCRITDNIMKGTNTVHYVEKGERGLQQLASRGLSATPPEEAVPAADIVTPNQFELGYLTRTEPDTLESTLASVDLVRETGPRTVLVTSVERPDREEGTIEMLAVDDAGAWIVQTPLLPMKANGSGDVTAALFTAHYRATGDAAAALARTTSSVFDLLSLTHESGQRELQLVEAQEFYAHPRLQFEVRQVR